MISLPGRASARRKIAAASAVALALGAFAVAKTQSVHAAPVVTPYSMDCSLAGTQLAAVTTNITSSLTPDTVHPGDSVTLDVKTDTPAGISLDVPVIQVVMKVPVPDQLDPTANPSVMIMGGNLTGTSAVSGGNLVLTL